MPLVLRGITQARWYRDMARPWLERGEIPTDPLTDLRTSDNTLSVFLVEDDLSDLGRVVTALAANRSNLKHFDYLLFDREVLSTTSIEAFPVAGTTADDDVNSRH